MKYRNCKDNCSNSFSIVCDYFEDLHFHLDENLWFNSRNEELLDFEKTPKIPCILVDC